MELFRKNQKLIFWIVTIIVVPSFVLVWGVGGLFDNRQQDADFDAGVVNGNRLAYREFDAFRRRLQAAVGGLQLELPGLPGSGTPAGELWKYLVAYAILQDAEKTGVRTSDLEVGTYLENGHPAIANRANHSDRQALERAVNDYCRQLQITRPELLRGIRELQAIGNYLNDDSGLAAVTDDTVFLFYALSRSQIDVKRIRVAKTDDMREQARGEIMGHPADQLERDARNYALGKSSDSRYRDPATWRFAYVLVPFVAAASVRQPTDQEMRDRYEGDKTTLYNEQSFEEAADAVRAALLESEIDRQTLRNLTVDVDPQLRQEGSTLPLDELAQLTPLAKYGIVTGDTGGELLSIDGLGGKLPAGFDSQVRTILQIVDEISGAEKEDIVREWKAGFNLAFPPFKSDAGYFRLRLLDYQSSMPADVDGPDGKIIPEILELAVADMIGDRVDELVAERAAELEEKLRLHAEAREAGNADADSDSDSDSEMAELLASLPSETIPLDRLDDRLADLPSLPVGEIVGPIPFEEDAASGQELVLLADRRVPTRKDFEAETPEIKGESRQRALSSFSAANGFIYTMNGPVALIQPGPGVMRSIWQRIYANQISVNPELLGSAGTEG